MSSVEKIVIKKREKLGKSSVKELRASGYVPCVFHDGSASTPYATNLKELLKTLEVKRFFLTQFDLVDESGKEIAKVLVREVIYDPVTELPIHIDFMKVTSKSKVLINVPIIFQNKEKAPGLMEGGQMKLFHYGIRMRVPFEDMPKEIVVDLGQMKLFDMIKLSDLPIPSTASVMYINKNDKIAFMKGVIKA